MDRIRNSTAIRLTGNICPLPPIYQSYDLFDYISCLYMHEYMSDSNFPYSECLECRKTSSHVCKDVIIATLVIPKLNS